MLIFLKENFSTVVVGLIVAGIVAAIIIKMFRDRKKGRTGCSCGCENCPRSSACGGHGKSD